MKLRDRNFSGAPVVLDVENLVVGLAHTSTSEPFLHGISLRIHKGETLCLVGESGSGKSITSLATMGLLPKGSLAVRSGRIMLSGENLLALGEAQMRAMRATRLSMIFQEPMTALNPVMPVGRQITEVLDLHTRLGKEEKRARVLDIMQQVHLPDVERIYRSFPHQLSGGQRQRIMIAMALILEPVLLIADEPTTALDVTTQKQILSLIAELQEKHGTAVLFITHDMGVVAEIADTVCVMRHGRVVESGPIGEILRAPREAYTRDLLDAIPALTPRAPRPETKEPPVMDVSDLGKTYHVGSLFNRRPPVKAAQGVTFTLKRGRTLGIVGESGSGKSTVARSIMRLIDPTEGHVYLEGHDIAYLPHPQLKRHRKHLQVVFQDPFRSLNPRWTIEKSLIEGPLNYGISRDEAVAEARRLLKIVSLPDDALNRYPHQFSGGQRQRIAIARAVALRPDVLVADEAVSALDVSVQAQVLDLLAELQEAVGIAIIFITHDLRVAAQICDDVIVMQRGIVVEQGPAAQVLAHPRHEYTRTLIDAAPGRFWDFAGRRYLEAG